MHPTQLRYEGGSLPTQLLPGGEKTRRERVKIDVGTTIVLKGLSGGNSSSSGGRSGAGRASGSSSGRGSKRSEGAAAAAAAAVGGDPLETGETIPLSEDSEMTFLSFI